jgi:oxygen-dependent protoporphyrinogen oxidase
MVKIVVIGGGVTGLACAHHVERLLPRSDIVLIDREPRLGGMIVTDNIDGFIVEGGADCFLSRKESGVELCEALGIASQLTGRRPEHNRTFVRFAGALHDLPQGLTGMVPTDVEALQNSTILSAQAKERVRGETTIPPGSPEESIAQFITRRFGREVYERIVEPLMSGIYAGDGEQLSIDAIFPALRAAEQQSGSVIEGLTATPTPRNTAYPPFVSFPRGMHQLIDALTGALTRTRVELGNGVAHLTQESGSVWRVVLDNGESIEADVVVLATPVSTTARLIDEVDPALARLHATIPHSSCITVSLAFDRLFDGTAGYGYLVPRVEGGHVLACTFSSNKWSGRAPEGSTLVRVYLGADDGKEITALSDDDAIEIARRELHNTAGVSQTPLFAKAYRWRESMPQYVLGHGERVRLIQSCVRALPGLHLAGTAYRGVGIPDCIRSGRSAAETIARQFASA